MNRVYASLQYFPNKSLRKNLHKMSLSIHNTRFQNSLRRWRRIIFLLYTCITKEIKFCDVVSLTCINLNEFDDSTVKCMQYLCVDTFSK